MTHYERILKEWSGTLALEKDSTWSKMLAAGTLKRSHYMGYLRETYHYTRINPQTQAYATMFFARDHRFIRQFLTHAAEEVAHDMLALNDVVELGADRAEVMNSRPLPMTAAFSALPFLHLQFGNPLAYLGHIFHLEYIATQSGPEVASTLFKLGIPKEALSFIGEHAEVDPKHNAMMKEYIGALVKTDEDADAVTYGATVASRAFSKMIEDACSFGERDYSRFD